MRLLVTRPRQQADAWVRRLRERGADAAALPLIDIGPPDDPAGVAAAWQGLAGQALVVFVSPSAAEQFFALRPPAMVWPGQTQAGAPGPGTAAVLRAAGVPATLVVEPAADAASFDSESLWAQLCGQDWAGRSALVVRGEEGRDWLAGALRARGASVEFVAAYRRLPPVLDAAGQALLAAALAAPGAHLWLFSSSEAVGHLQALAPGADWRGARALATHPRIAQTAHAAGFGAVRRSAPALTEVLQAARAWSIESPAK